MNGLYIVKITIENFAIYDKCICDVLNNFHYWHACFRIGNIVPKNAAAPA
ncbi:hypothetical protein LDG_5889 [Legionella drancourtii LLAP12]|uniref:Uncharacterized protein n=1 Tax=Legionella drancourtii LLAP12 TaxID=658187 RepID=G9EKZ5_9GAMM|nr:hypothetical protein LDG_5889 [Legionella drancourtii LLAP12]